MQQQMAQMDRLVNELDQLTVGWTIDAREKVAYLEMVMTAVSGSALSIVRRRLISLPARRAGSAPDRASRVRSGLPAR